MGRLPDLERKGSKAGMNGNTSEVQAESIPKWHENDLRH